MRKYLVAQHLVVLYALLDDADMVKRWLRTSLEQVQAEISGQASHLHSAVVDYLVNPRKPSGNVRKDALHFKVQVNALTGHYGYIDKSIASARYAVRSPFVTPKYHAGGVAEAQTWEGFIPRSADLEGWLSGLAELTAESAGARRLCEVAGVPGYTMPPNKWTDGAVRIYKGKTERFGPGVLVRFSQFVAVEFAISGGQDSPICRPLPAELRQARNWQRWDKPLFAETWDYEAEGYPELWMMGTGIRRGIKGAPPYVSEAIDFA
jgi:hypothetical protein